MTVFTGKNKPLTLAGAISGVLVIYLLFRGGPPASPSVTWTASEQHEPLTADMEAPDFTLATAQGESVRLADLKGRRVGLVFVTAICPYCNKLEEQLEAFTLPQDRHLLIICKGGKTDAQKIEQAHTLRFSVLVDSTGEIHQAYQVRSVPLVYLVDETGRVEFSARGMPDAWEMIVKLQKEKEPSVEKKS